MRKLKIWSCKINRPDTLKSHLKLSSAVKKAGNYGFVYDPSCDIVYQIIEMADGTLKRFDTISESEHCDTLGFDLRLALKQFSIPTAKDRL